MWPVIGANAALAVILALWLRALLRARRGAIPCTPGSASPLVIAAGIAALVGAVVINVLVLRALGQLGRDLDPLAFTLWLAMVSAVSILFIVDISTLQVNRAALVWIRIAEPDALIVREPGAETTIRLAPSSVSAFIVGNGMSGPAYVQYHVAHGDRRLNLVVPFTLTAAASTDGAPWLGAYLGPVAQGGARRLNRFLAPFCQKHPRPGAG
jgi:hypothetical protein